MFITRLRHLRAGLFALLLGAAVAGPAAVSVAAGETGESSFPVVTNVFRGALRERTMVRGSVELRAGRRYRLTLSCDEDCKGVAFGLSGPAGQTSRLAIEGGSGQVDVLPLTGGQHQLLVAMGRCDRQPCVWRLEVRTTPARASSPFQIALTPARAAPHERLTRTTAGSTRHPHFTENER